MHSRPALFLVFVFSFVTAMAQSPKRKADSLYRVKEFAAAAPLYLQSASLAEFKGARVGDYYNAACCFALAGQPDSAFTYLKKAVAGGWNNKAHVLKDSDLNSLHVSGEWEEVLNSIKETKTWTGDPLEAKLVTTDITNFWKAYDLAQHDTANRLAIYRQHYIDPGTPGLQDYFASKVGNMRSFVSGHDRRSRFYEAIRPNTLQVERLKPQMTESFVRFKALYPQARFSNVYFVIGNYTSGGTASANGLLIGTDQMARTSNVPLDELNLWEKNNFQSLESS